MVELDMEQSINAVPEVNRQRYRYEYDVRHSTTMNVGVIAPIYVNPLINPGDTVKIGCRLFLSLTTSLFATQDQLFADIYFFQERNINLGPWKKLWGENEKGDWAVQQEIEAPKIIITPTDEITKDYVLNKMGIPQMQGGQSTGRTQNIEIPLYPYLLYYRIYNEYFRDQNYIPPVDLTDLYGESNINLSSLKSRGMVNMLNASRCHDLYYTLPEPRKGDAPAIPVGTSAPVYGTGNSVAWIGSKSVGGELETALTSLHTGDYSAVRMSNMVSNTMAGQNGSPNANKYKGGSLIGLARKEDLDTYKYAVADLSQAVGAQLDEQRYVLGINHIFETMALYGSRYREMLRGSFGVISSSELNNIPEFLGAKHIPLDMTTVLQTSQSTDNDFLGGTAGFSNTIADEDEIFTKSFDVHSTIMGICVIRQTHSYCQGLPLWALKSRKYDFYNPELEGLSNVAMPKSAIMVTGTSTDNDTWGFHSIYNEYRGEANLTTGMLAPNSVNNAGNTNIANYMYTDYYENVPVNGKEWLEEKTDFVDRTLTVPSNKVDQFRCDFVFNVIKLTEVPRLELPGIERF